MSADAGTGDAGRLILESNLDDPDGFYDELLAAHDGLDDAASDALNARLILVLCNHVGDRAVIREALATARGAVDDDAPGRDDATGPKTVTGS